MPEDNTVTAALQAYRQGAPGAFDRLVTLLYDDLRRIARRQLGGGVGRTMNSTGLVHEVYLKMMDHGRVSVNDRTHFFGVAARAMRQILVDHARRRASQKRGGGRHPTSLDEAMGAVAADAEHLLLVHEALERLTAVDPRLTRVIDCRLFGGYTEEETAEILGTSSRTVHRDWVRGRAWLLALLQDPPRGGPTEPDPPM